MDTTSFWFLLVIVLAGGTVAWYGDMLGSKLGKKRITLFKMRPRKFAALMTFLFGCLGTLLTILILFATSAPIRNWIIEGNAAQARLAKTTKDLADAEKKFGDAESRLKTLEPELKSKTTEVNQKNKELEEAKIEQLSLNTKNKDLDRKGKDLLKKVSSLTSQFKSVNTELLSLKKTKESLDEQIVIAKNDQKRIEGNNKTIQERNLELEQEALGLERRAEKLQEEFVGLEKEYDTLLQASRDADAKFNSQLENYQSELRRAESDLNKTLRDLESSKNQLFALQTSGKVTERRIETSRMNSMTFPAGAEVFRYVAPARMNLNEAIQAVNSFKRGFESAAKEKGAAQTFEGSYAGLYDDELNGKRFTAEAQLNALAQGLVGRPNPSVLVARAVINSFVEDFIPIKIYVYDNVKAFDQGDVIYSMQIDGRKAVPDIVSSIIEQVDKGLAKALVDKNMIPVVGSSQPFGELSTQKIVEIALEIKESGFPLRLQLMATKDIYSADKIQFGHRLRP